MAGRPLTSVPGAQFVVSTPVGASVVACARETSDIWSRGEGRGIDPCRSLRGGLCQGDL